MQTVGRVLREGLVAEAISITGGLVAGLALVSMTAQLEEAPGILVMIPAILGMRGNISGSLASRLGSALHRGVLDPKLTLNDELLQNVLGSFALTVFESLLIGVFSSLVSFLVGIDVSALSLILIALVTGLLSAAISIPLTSYLTTLVFARGVDPDSVMGPIVTTTGDLISIFCLFIAAWLVGGGF